MQHGPAAWQDIRKGGGGVLGKAPGSSVVPLQLQANLQQSPENTCHADDKAGAGTETAVNACTFQGQRPVTVRPRGPIRTPVRGQGIPATCLGDWTEFQAPGFDMAP